MPFDWSLLWLSLRYAGMATLFSVLAGLPLAWLLARRRFPGRDLLDSAATLPLLLPPAVLVYYLLASLGRWPLLFTWRRALVLGTICTLPLLLRIARAGLEAVDHGFENAARGLGASEWRVFWRITMPLAWRTVLAAMLAGFARALADFGATAAVKSNGADTNQAILYVLVLAATALAALYAGNRLRGGRVWA
jgi:molybdate transport system permease protein